MTATKTHPFAGKRVSLTPIACKSLGVPEGSTYQVEDYWLTVAGVSWKNAHGNPACLNYAIRTGLSDIRIPTDDEVLYGKIGALGYLVHVSECLGVVG